MKRTLLVCLCVVALVGLAMAQNPQYTGGAVGIQGVDKLGAHQNGGRGCVGCHVPHSGARGNGGNAATGVPPFPFYQREAVKKSLFSGHPGENRGPGSF